jgi:imidazolonepropionase-like amidohydrolase
MPDRGFTTVRATGGADWGGKTAPNRVIWVGPRLFIAGMSIGSTGGQAAGRRRGDANGCSCCNGLKFKSAIAGGSDLVRKTAREQMRQGAGQMKILSREFSLRTEVVSPIEIIRSAKPIAAQILRLDGKVGPLLPGAWADLLLVDGASSARLTLREVQGRHLPIIKQAGRFHKRRLN